MTIANKTILVTGANSGIGRALVAEALSREAGRGVRVHAILTGPVDTDMTRGFDIPKSSAASVAAGIFDGLENGEEVIFPDSYSEAMADGWRTGTAKALERELAAFVEAAPARS